MRLQVFLRQSEELIQWYHDSSHQSLVCIATSSANRYMLLLPGRSFLCEAENHFPVRTVAHHHHSASRAVFFPSPYVLQTRDVRFLREKLPNQHSPLHP